MPEVRDAALHKLHFVLALVYAHGKANVRDCQYADAFIVHRNRQGKPAMRVGWRGFILPDCGSVGCEQRFIRARRGRFGSGGSDHGDAIISGVYSDIGIVKINLGRCFNIESRRVVFGQIRLCADAENGENDHREQSQQNGNSESFHF
jgi:hypothetical protein